MIFDTHAHFDDKAYDEDREELLNKVHENQVEMIVNVGADIESSKRTLELIKQYSFIYGAIGIHPSETEKLTLKDMEWLKDQSQNDKIVAIGEIGLDYYWPEPEREIQIKWFKEQLRIASEVKLPVIIHSRDAAKDTLGILKEWNDKKYAGGVIHCFSYSKEMAREYLDMGFYIGIGGVLTFKNAKKLVEVAEYVPLERILLETDCPYLAPEPNRGKRNESDYIDYVAEKLSQIKHTTKEEVLNKTMENAKAFYHIA